MHWIAVADRQALRQIAHQRILASAGRAIERHGKFMIVLAGGSTPRDVYRSLRGANADWLHWQVYFGDERCLPVDDPERNSAMAADAWLDHVPIPREQVHAIPAELGPNAGALEYAATLRDVGTFDLVLLGLGEDGHTASLFPGHDWGVAADAPEAAGIRRTQVAAAPRVAECKTVESYTRSAVSGRRRNEAPRSYAMVCRCRHSRASRPPRGRRRCARGSEALARRVHSRETRCQARGVARSRASLHAIRSRWIGRLQLPYNAVDLSSEQTRGASSERRSPGTGSSRRTT